MADATYSMAIFWITLKIENAKKSDFRDKYFFLTSYIKRQVISLLVANFCFKIFEKNFYNLKFRKFFNFDIFIIRLFIIKSPISLTLTSMEA